MDRITDRVCSQCGDALWSIDRGAGEVIACPSCDRARCVVCRRPFGFLLAPYVRRLSGPDDGSRCEDCIVSGATRED